MKSILISSKIIKDKFNTLNHVIENDWIKYFSRKRVKLLPINTNSFNSKDLNFFKPIAVIISGGNDIKKVNKSETNILRDKNDEFLYKYALKKKNPDPWSVSWLSLYCTKTWRKNSKDKKTCKKKSYYFSKRLF